MEKIIAIVMAIVSFFATVFGILTGRGGGDKPVDPPTTAVVTTAPVQAGLNSTDKATVITFYQKAAKATVEDASYHQTLYLNRLEGGEGGVGSLIRAFEPIAKKALAKNSTDFDGLPGDYTKLTAADLKSAKAYTQGDYTFIEMYPVVQTDGANGRINDGPVGHAIGVLDGVDTAIKELNGVTVDYSQGKIELKYTDAYVKVKVDNNTGEIVDGTWGHKVNVSLTNVNVKIAFISATLNGTKAVISYDIKMK